MRRILALFLPTLPTDRLARGAPSPRPLATIAQAGNRRLVGAANAAAQAAGIAPGMPVPDAQALLPSLALVPEDPVADAALLACLADWCQRWTPSTATDGVDGLKLDVTGCAHLFGGETRLLAEVMDRVLGLGLACRGAIAGTPGAAWALAHFGAEAATIVAPGNTTAALDPLPPTALRLPLEDAHLLDRLGLSRIGMLREIPRDALARRFGDRVAKRLDQALGRIAEQLSPRRSPPERRRRLAFAEPIAAPEDIARAARHLLADLCRGLEAEGTGVRRLVLSAYRGDGETPRVEAGTARPNRDAKHLFRLFEENLATIDPGLGIDEMTLDAFSVEPLGTRQAAIPLPPGERERGRGPSRLALMRQPSLQPSPRMGEGAIGEMRWVAKPLKKPVPPPKPPEHDEGLALLVDRLGSRLGLDNVFRLAPVESHVPERAQKPVGVFAPFREAWAPGTARPVRLLDPPEPIEVMALVPDHPPAWFLWRRVRRTVLRADGPERIAPEWWRAAGPTRDYYRVEDDEGRRYWLFRAGLFGTETATPRWYLHGLFA